jgi:ProP effector
MPETPWTAHPKETIAALPAQFPNCFRLAGRERRPLKIGIAKELEALATGIDLKALKTAVGWYTSNLGYLHNMAAGADRIGLDGAPSGSVRPEDAVHARHRIERINAMQKAKRENGHATAPGRPAGTPNGIESTEAAPSASKHQRAVMKPAGLAALKAAAEARRQACR